MKATGIVRCVGAEGRIVIPTEILRLHGWRSGQPLEIFAGDDATVILRAFEAACIFCGNLTVAEGEFRGKRICPNCREALQARWSEERGEPGHAPSDH